MARGKKVCKARGCRSPIHARGLCQRCYDKMRKKNGGGVGQSGGPRACKVPDCDRPHHAQGYCQRCYDIQRKKTREAQRKTAGPTGDDSAQRGDPKAAIGCQAPDCNEPHHAKGYCKRCYSRLRRSGGFADEPRTLRAVDSRADKGRTRGKAPTRAASVASPATGRSRLEELKRRYERMRREIARIAEAFDTEEGFEEEER